MEPIVTLSILLAIVVVVLLVIGAKNILGNTQRAKSKSKAENMAYAKAAEGMIRHGGLGLSDEEEKKARELIERIKNK